MSAALLALAMSSAVQSDRACADSLLPRRATSPTRPEERSGRSDTRRITAGDIVRLRSFGQMDEGNGDEALFTISPDRRSVALQLRRGDPASNSYCLGLVIVDIATGAARLLDTGGELVRPTFPHAGILAGTSSGVPQVITPAWSPDGRWIAVLRRDDGRTRAWRFSTDGGESEPLTDEAQDVTAVAWSSDGGRIIYRTDRALEPSERAIDTEGSTGWRYDDRFAPMFRPRPYPRPGDPDQEVFTRDLTTGVVSAASAADRVRLEAIATSSGLPEKTDPGPAPFLATKPAAVAGVQPEQSLRAWRHGREQVCGEKVCARSRGFWPAPDHRSVLFLARSGWGDGDLTFYRWNVRSGRVTALSTTSDLLSGCRPLGREMLCAREGSLMPRQLALVDPLTGRSHTLFDPNSEFHEREVGSVERLRLMSMTGIKTFADLVLPPGFDPRRHYPLIVVQYTSRGFLNGGTGNEFPILAFAAADAVVLSFQRTTDVATRAFPAPATTEEFTRVDYERWIDRRNVHSALMQGVDEVLRRGFIDRDRVGITGLSDGVGTAAFALLNSDVFSAAALTHCCEEPVNVLALQGPAFTRWMLAAGLPPLSRPEPSRWAGYSIAQEATRVRAPLLIQSPDREYILSLPTYEALKETGLPVELYVYPDEFHIKWQPAHKLAVAERTLRWFAFWFGLPQGSSELPVPPDELVRWQAMREAWRSQARVDGVVTHGGEPTPPRQ